MELFSQKAPESAKEAAGVKAAELIENGMKIGLGTGSTAKYFIQALSERCKQGLQIQAASTSKATESLARTAGIPLLASEEIVQLDLAIDGADEIDSAKRMIKGGGGALFREKIIASSSREMIVIVDESKVVQQLGRFPVPVEVFPFGCHATRRKLEEKGFAGKWRKQPDGSFFVTDNGNYIYDIAYPGLCGNPERDDAILHAIPGVIETGFFLGMAGRVIIGFLNGRIEIRQ
jgi:ribose 5-phosphate isomerase A